jgi:hypothetical protein
MGRVHVNELPGPGLHPTVCRAAAWKHERVGSFRINNGELEITVVWRRSNRLPLH